MVVLAVHLDQLGCEARAHLAKHLAQARQGVAVEYLAPILRHEDQMDVHRENTVPTAPYFVAAPHRPKYNYSMKRQQAFRFELMPDGAQKRLMVRFAGCCRFAYNRALELQEARRSRGEKRLGYAALCREITKWRNAEATDWLAEAPVHPLQQAMKDLGRAYQHFFAGRACFPRFRKRGQHERFRYPDPAQIKLDQANSRLFLPKLGWMRYRNSRDVLGAVRNATVSRSCGKWYVAIQTEREVHPPARAGSAVGIDVGVVRFATLSDGTVYRPLDSFKRHERRLRKAQRRLSQKTKHSRNWHKARARVQRVHIRIANARRDYLHKRSTAVSKNHATVCIEDLRVQNMVASAKGTAERPGTNVRAKSRLNRSILDQGWSEFRRQLDYKQAWSGGRLVAVPPHNTSRTCPRCGHAARANRPTQARFACVACGFEGHADFVAATNILRAGHARIACEVNGTPKPSAAGTRRSDQPGFIPADAVGIPVL